jgi:hypothetical protein
MKEKCGLYSMGINAILDDYQMIFKEDYFEKYFISTKFILDDKFLRDFQNNNYERVKSFSIELSDSIRYNKEFGQILPNDCIIVKYQAEQINKDELDQYFDPKNQTKSWEMFYSEKGIGAIVSLTPIYFDKHREKATFFVFFAAAHSPGGRVYLVYLSNENKIWQISEITLIAHTKSG